MITIAATGDLHLGMKFSSHPEVAELLADARFLALERLVSDANSQGADLLLIAGDLFDRPRVSESVVSRAVGILSRFEGTLVAVLPGNHDYAASDDAPPWDRFLNSVAEAKSEIVLLKHAAPFELSPWELDLLLLPGPCDARHREHHAIGWAAEITPDALGGFELQEPGASTSDTRTIIGVAHGSVEGVSPDLQGRYFPMRLADFARTQAHLWVVGHTHAPAEIETRPGQRLIIPGTPEPDGFDCAIEGGYSLIRADSGRVIEHVRRRVGGYRFLDRTVDPATPDALSSVDTDFERFDRGSTLIRLTLKGTLASEEVAELREMIARWTEEFLLCRIDDSGVTEELTRKRIDSEYPADSFPHRLLLSLVESGDEEAAQVAVAFLERARDGAR